MPLDSLAEIRDEWSVYQGVPVAKFDMVVPDSCQVHQDGGMGEGSVGVHAVVPESGF